jgi:hypothetical protein
MRRWDRRPIDVRSCSCSCSSAATEGGVVSAFLSHGVVVWVCVCVSAFQIRFHRCCCLSRLAQSASRSVRTAVVVVSETSLRFGGGGCPSPDGQTPRLRAFEISIDKVCGWRSSARSHRRRLSKKLRRVRGRAFSSPPFDRSNPSPNLSLDKKFNPNTEFAIISKTCWIISFPPRFDQHIPRLVPI